jgi:hypothetical protein
MKNRDTRMKVLEWKMRAHLLREDKAYFHSLSDADLTTLLSQASDLDRELISQSLQDDRCSYAANRNGSASAVRCRRTSFRASWWAVRCSWWAPQSQAKSCLSVNALQELPG